MKSKLLLVTTINIFFLMFLSSCSDSQSHYTQSKTPNDATSISNTKMINTATINTATIDTTTIDTTTVLATSKPEVDFSSYTGNWICKENATSIEIKVDSFGNVTGSITTVVDSHVSSSSIGGKIKAGILTSKLLVDDLDTGTLELSFAEPDILTGNVKLDKDISYWTLGQGDMRFFRYSIEDENSNDSTSNSDTIGIVKSESLEILKLVLQNEVSFYSTEDTKVIDLSDFLNKLPEYDIKVKVTHFTVLDMDEDKTSEVVLELSVDGKEYPDFYEVLRYLNGTVYGYNFAVRGFEELKADGTLMYSNGAFDWGVSKLTFTSDSYVYHYLAYCESSDNQQTEGYFINSKPVTKDSFNSFVNKQDGKKGAVWHEFSPQNIETELSSH